MKKLLAFLLTLAMLFAMTAVPAVALDAEPEAQADVQRTYEFDEEELDEKPDTVKVGDITYNVVWNATQFLGMQGVDRGSTGAPEYYILGQDIDFTDISLNAVKGGAYAPAVVNAGNKLHNFVLDGNGHSLNNMVLNFSAEGSGLFPTATYRSITIRNLTVNAECSFSAGYCGVLFGKTADNSCSIGVENVAVNATVKESAQGVGLFVAQNNAKTSMSFTDCKAKGTWDFSFNSAQAGGFIGQNKQKATFLRCSIDATVVSRNNRKGGFIGQQYTTAAVTFTDCSASGEFYELGNSKWLSGYIGAVYKANTVTFNNCESDIKFAGDSAMSGYIGGFNSDATGTVNFNGCSFSGKGIAVNNAGGFVGEGGTATTINLTGCTSSGTLISAQGDANPFVAGKHGKGTIDDSCVSTATITEMGYVYTDAAETEEELAGNALLATGAQACDLYDAQETLGLTKYRFGQVLGTDPHAYLGQSRVYKAETAKGFVKYSNTEIVHNEMEAPTDAYAIYTDVKSTDAGYSFSVLIDVSDAYLDEVASMTLKVTFRTSETGAKSFTYKDTEIQKFYAVDAGSTVYEAADGRMLIVAVIDGITSEWTGDVRITLVTDGSDDANAAYNASTTFNAFE